MSQPDLFDPHPPFVKGSDTSEAAADSMVISAKTIRAAVLAYLREGSATCDEVEIGLCLSHQTASARLRELCLMGAARDSGGRRPTRSGRQARVYVAITHEAK